MSQTKHFKAESKQLLELMIHSIYSHKEVFLRELISNASDALDKRHFRSLQNKKYEYKELQIMLDVDKVNRTLTITDTGIGMSSEEVEDLLGTIAKSGSKEFLEKYKKASQEETIDVIGQFGVGFYSSFIVADEVTVISKAPGSKAVRWHSTGEDTYDIEEADKKEIGTSVTLKIKSGKEFDDFLQQEVIESLVKKYSDFVRYPIMMEIETEIPVLDAEGNHTGDYSKTTELKTLNSVTAIWKRNKRSIKEEDYNEFYKTKFHDWRNPRKTFHFNVEGTTSFTALLFIPETKSVDFYLPTYKKGIDLYSKGIFIEEECSYLVPESFKFVKGLVDSDDINLNISREMLQKDAEITKLANTLEKKIKSELVKWLKKDPEAYEAFFKEFGMQIKYALYDNFGAKKDLLKDLIIFNSINAENMVSLQNYVETMQVDQEHIYYIAAETVDMAKAMPQVAKFKEKGIDVLILTDDVDEFALKILVDYAGKTFKSITDLDVDLSTEEEKEKLTKKEEAAKDLLDVIKKDLEDRISKVRFTSKLDDTCAVSLSSEGEISIEMEKTFAKQPTQSPFPVVATKILEINPEHKLYKAMEKIYKEDPKSKDIDLFAEVLVDQAYLMAGLEIKDVMRFTNLVTEIMIKATK